jgi:Fe-S cluster biogenesis protein NfuA
MRLHFERFFKPFLTLLKPPPGPAAASPNGGQPAGAADGTVLVTHAWTAEPNALKLQVNRLLLPLGEQRGYERPDQAGDSPLAQALFGLPGVTRVGIDSASVTVLLAEDADWDALHHRVPEALRGHLEAGHPAVNGAAERKKYNFGFRAITARPAEEQYRIVKDIFEQEVNPAVAAHGGHFTLLDVKDNNVYVKLGGGCQGCGMADVTLRQGVEQRLRQVLPEMVSLIDVTDHASGTNPYYQPGK